MTTSRSANLLSGQLEDADDTTKTRQGVKEKGRQGEILADKSRLSPGLLVFSYVVVLEIISLIS